MKENEIDIMKFLNNVRNDYPDAISMASGRPDGRLFKIKECLDLLIEQLVEGDKNDQITKEEWIGQYNSARGTITEELIKYYSVDHQIELKQEELIVTVGAQEAMAMCIEYFSNLGVVACENPSYIGFSYFSKLINTEVVPVDVDDTQTINVDRLEQILIGQQTGNSIKLLYLITDFQNPTGAVMSFAKRKQILALAEEHDFYILEDNAYRIFRYDGNHIPTLLELDEHQRVIHVESFSKSVFPSLRLALLSCRNTDLVDKLLEYKRYITVNTSGLNQELLKVILLEYNYSLKIFNKDKSLTLKNKRDLLVKTLNKEASNIKLKYKIPEGGFFISIELPFELTNKDVIEAAEKYKIVFCLYSFFTISNNPTKFIRISFSEISFEEIEIGVKRLIEFLNNKQLIA